jgi:hypothetical protein
MRALFYTMMVASGDEETQKKGMIYIVFNFGPKRVAHKMTAALKVRTVLWRAPVRLVALHCVFDSDSLGPMNAALVTAVNKMMKVRSRFHQGTILECSYDLMTFGIPTESLPVNNIGEFLMENHRHWLEERRQAEDESKDYTDRVILVPTMIVPGPNDVVYGRDRFALHHPGNAHYLILIDERREEYEHTQSRTEKTEVANGIVNAIRESGGRFLKRADVGWAAVDDVTARYKVASAFRAMRANEIKKARNNADKPFNSGSSGDKDLDKHAKRQRVELSPSPTT